MQKNLDNEAASEGLASGVAAAPSADALQPAMQRSKDSLSENQLSCSSTGDLQNFTQVEDPAAANTAANSESKPSIELGQAPSLLLADTSQVPWIPRNFKQQYAWVIVQLEKTSQALNAALLRLRQRCSPPNRRPSSGEGSPFHFRSISPRQSPIEDILFLCQSKATNLVVSTRNELLRSGKLSRRSVLCTEDGQYINRVLGDILALLMRLRVFAHCLGVLRLMFAVIVYFARRGFF